MLSVMAHGETEQGGTIAGALLPALALLDEERSRYYFDVLLESVNEASRRALEAMMKRRRIDPERFCEEVRRAGPGPGRAVGRTEEAARNLLTVLRVRGIAVPDAAREWHPGRNGPSLLERWLAWAVVAASVEPRWSSAPC